MTVIIGPGGPGGSYDFYARALAHHIGRHLPGEPVVVPQNMNGAAGMVAANHLYNVAPKDGTAIGIIAESAAIAEALETQAVRYQAARFNWIGRLLDSVNVTLTWHSSKVRSMADAMQTEVPLSATSPGSAAYDLPATLAALIGAKFKVIPGYRGSAPMLLAMERGETDGAFTEWNSLKILHSDWLRDRKVNVLVQYAQERQPDLPDVPAAVELGRTEEERRVLGLFMSSASVGRAIVAPPGVPPGTVKLLRDAFDATMRDPRFLGELKEANAPISPLSGEKLQQIVAAVAETPPEVLHRAKAVNVTPP